MNAKSNERPEGRRQRLVRVPAWPQPPRADNDAWISRRRAVNIAAKIEDVAVAIDNALGDDEGSLMWQAALRRIAKQLAPELTPMEAVKVK